MTREEAIRHLTSLRIHSQNRQLGKDIEALDKAVEVLEQTKWIPCSERLPEKNGNYLVTYESSDGTATLRYEVVDHYGPDWLHKTKHNKAVAWVPLPEPYKAESEV